jgi:hypothetical protein
MATTTNFGWETPDDTDLVKDGALAIRTLGSAIDTSLVDLKGGTTGQVLSKTSNTDMDFTWVTSDDANAIQNTIVDAKGDLLTATAADTPARLAVGSANQVLTVDSSTATGLKWATPATGALTKITSASFTTQSSVTIDSVFSSTYTRYMMRLRILGSSAAAEPQIQLRYGSTTLSSGYYGSGFSYDRNNGLQTHGFVNTAAYRIDLGLNTVRSEYLVNFGGVGNASEEGYIWGNGYGDYSNQRITQFAGLAASNNTYTGLLLKASTGTITGSYVIYGLEN